MRLVVGLGNPGPAYAQTRHNLGFQVIDALATRWRLKSVSKFQSEWFDGELSGKKVSLMKPQTYMNRSGLAVSEAARFFKISPSEIMVVVDDLDRPKGMLRLRKAGSSGGHNGLQSVGIELASFDFPRLRIGISRPPDEDAKDAVLAKIPKADQALFDEAIGRACSAIEVAITDGFEAAMNRFNEREKIVP